MTNVGQIGIDLILNNKSFKKSLNDIQQQANNACTKLSNSVGKSLNSVQTQVDSMGSKVSSSFGKIAKTIGATFSAALIAKFGKSCVDLGSDLTEVQNVVDVTFKNMSSSVNDWATNAQSQFGLSETMAKKYVGTFGSMAEAFGFSEKQAYNMSTTLTGLAGDVASFYNISQDEAYTKLKSVFSGETETLKDLGIVMTQTALDSYALANGYGKTTSKMTEAEKVALRYTFVQDQLKNATGDFARTQDQWANQTRILQLRWDSLKATIGQGLINALTPVLKVINNLVERVSFLADKFKEFTDSVFGNTGGGTASQLDSVAQSATSLTDAASDSSEAIDSISNSAKKAKKGLAGFDKLNVLTKTETTNKTISVDKATSNKIDNTGLKKASKTIKQIKKYIESAVTTFNTGFKKGFGNTSLELLKKNVQLIGTSLKDIFTNKDVLKAAKKCAKALVENLGTVIGSALNIGIKWVTSFTSGISKQLKKSKDQIIKFLTETFGTWESIFDAMGDIALALKDILTSSEVLKAIEEFGASFCELLIAKVEAYISVGTTIAYNIVEGVKKYIEQNSQIIKERIVAIFDITSRINGITATLYTAFADIFEVFRSDDATQCTADIIGIFTDGISGAVVVLGEFATDVYDLLVSPITDNAKKIKETLQGLFKPLSKVLHTIKKVIDDTFKHFQDVYDKKIHPALMSIKNTISEVFGVVLDAWNKYVQPVINKLSEKFTKLWKTLQPYINKLSDSIGKIFTKIKEYIDYIKPAVEAVIGVVMPFISAIISALGGELMNIFKGLFKIISSIVSFFIDLGSIIMDLVTGNFEGVKEDFGDLWDSIVGIFSGIWDVIKAPFVAFKEYFVTLWDGIKDIFAPVINWFKKTFGGAWKAIKKAFAPFIKFFSHVWAGIKKVFSSVGKWFSNIFKSAWNGIKNVWKGGTGFFKGIWSGIKKVFKNVGSWFANIFKGAWQGIKNVFSGVGKWFKNLFKGILKFIKAPINLLIDGLNTLIKGVNKISFDVPDWVPAIGGKKFGFNIPEIPKLAKGGLVKAPTLAVVGDNPGASSGNPEVVAPLNKLENIMQKSSSSEDTEILKQILMYLKRLYEMYIVFKNKGGNYYEFIAKINGSTLFKELIHQNNLYKKRHNGKSAFA